MRLPDLMTHPPIRSWAAAFLLGFAAGFLALFVPTILGARGPELGVLAMMLAAIPAVFVASLKNELENYAAWIRQWGIHSVYFLGVSACLATWCMTRTTTEVWSGFSFVLNLPEVKLITLDQGRFPPAMELIPHNLGVGLAMAFLTLTYGAAGGSALLTWNVGVWSVTLTMLIARSSEVYSYSTAALSILPHSVIELLAYSLIIVVSARLRCWKDSPPAERGLIAVMMPAAFMLIGIAALIESSWPAWVLSR